MIDAGSDPALMRNCVDQPENCNPVHKSNPTYYDFKFLNDSAINFNT